jgi:hypothetical protein
MNDWLIYRSSFVYVVNRCQTQLQRSIGEPAQAHKVEDLCKDFQSTDRRLDSLDKQIDALRVVPFPLHSYPVLLK